VWNLTPTGNISRGNVVNENARRQRARWKTERERKKGEHLRGKENKTRAIHNERGPTSALQSLMSRVCAK